jgi:hypothetical protein
MGRWKFIAVLFENEKKMRKIDTQCNNNNNGREEEQK